MYGHNQRQRGSGRSSGGNPYGQDQRSRGSQQDHRQGQNYRSNPNSTNNASYDPPKFHHPTHDPAQLVQEQITQFLLKTQVAQAQSYSQAYSPAPPQNMQQHSSGYVVATNTVGNPSDEGTNAVLRQSAYSSYSSPGLAGVAPAGLLPLPRPGTETPGGRRQDVTPQRLNYAQGNVQLKANAPYQQGVLQAEKKGEVSSGSTPIAMSKMNPDDLLTNFRSLECAGCQRHFGYQSRKNKDIVFCAASCMDDHSSCLPTIIEKKDTQQPPLLPNPPNILPNMVQNDQRRPLQQPVVSPAQSGGYSSGGFGSTPSPMHPEIRGSFSSALPNPNDFQNGPRQYQPRDQQQNRGSGDNRSLPRSNGYRSEGGDRRSGGSGNYGQSNGPTTGGGTGYGSRDRERFSGNRSGSGVGSGTGAERRGGASHAQGRKPGDKGPFSIGDDDSEWVNTDVVDRKLDVPQQPVTTAAVPTKPREPLATLQAAKESLVNVEKERTAAKVSASNSAQPVVSPPPPITRASVSSDKKVIELTPDKLISGLTPALNWTALKVGLPVMLERTFVNETGDFFAQGFDTHKAGGTMADDIAKFIESGAVTKLQKFEPKTLCLAPFSGEFYRAEILGPSAGLPHQVDLFFSDYGNIETVGMDVIFELPMKLAPLPRLTCHCLWDIKVSKDFGEAKMHQIFENEGLQVTPILEIAPGQYLVQLGEYSANAEFKVVKPTVHQVVTQATNSAPPVVEPPQATPPAVPTQEVKLASPQPKVTAPVPTPPAPEVKVAIPKPEATTPAPTPPAPEVEVKVTAAPATQVTPPPAAAAPKEPAPVAKALTPSGTSRFTGTRPPVVKAQTPNTVPTRKKYLFKDLEYSPDLQANLELFIGFPWSETRYLMMGTAHDAEAPKLQALIDEQRESCDKLKPDEAPVVGEVLVAFYDEAYYRGVVKSVDLTTKTALLEFIDFGDQSESKFEDLYLPNAAMMAIPILALNVTIPKLEPTDVEPVGVADDYTDKPMQMQVLNSEDRITDDVEVALWVTNDFTLNAIVHKDKP